MSYARLGLQASSSHIRVPRYIYATIMNAHMQQIHKFNYYILPASCKGWQAILLKHSCIFISCIYWGLSNKNCYFNHRLYHTSSGKLSREKTFTNSVVLEPPAKVFSTKFGRCTVPPIIGFSIPWKFSPTAKWSLLTNSGSFLPRKFPTIRYIPLPYVSTHVLPSASE